MKRFLCAIALLLLLAAVPLMAQEETNLYLIEAQGNLPSQLSAMVANAGGTLYRVHPELGLAVAQSDSPDFGAIMENYQGIKKCSRDMIVQWVPSADDFNVGAVEAPETSGHGGNPAGAFFYPCQWNLHQIDAAGAWAQDQLGDPNVTVAVLDTGTDPSHIDLAGRIDIANSATFVTSSPCGALDTASFLDRNFHGSFVSGVITSNSIGIAGVAPLTRVVGVKVLNCLGSGSFSDVIAGILYAASLPNVDVINMSLGARFPKNLPGAGPLVAAMNKAVNFAVSNGKLVVSSAGNNGADLDHDGNFVNVPAQSGSGISAWAGDINGGLAGYSNHGLSGVWVGAGGGSSVQGPPLPGCGLSLAAQAGIASVCATTSIFFPPCAANGFYLVGGRGTSFSAPAVSGVAALADGKHGGSMNSGQLKTILKNTADDIGKTGADNLFSHGRVNAREAVKP